MSAVGKTDDVDGCAGVVPEHRQSIVGAAHADDQIVAVAPENEVSRQQFVTDRQRIDLAGRSVDVVDEILAAADSPGVGVGTATAAQVVVAGAALETVADAGTTEGVVAGGTDEVETFGEQFGVSQHGAAVELETVDRRGSGDPEGIVRIESVDVDGVVGVAADPDPERAQLQLEVVRHDAGTEAQGVEQP